MRDHHTNLIKPGSSVETIVTEIIKTIKDSDTVIERNMKLLALFFELFRTALGMALEQLYRELATEYKKQGYVVERRDRRTVQCLCGTISFVRRRMKKTGKKGIYPLDKQLRLKPYQRFSALLMKKVAETATSCVYRKTADIVNRFTLTNLSHQTVKHIVMQSGKLCQEWQDIQRQETPVEETEDPVERLRKYLTRNWTYVEPLNQRQMPENVHLIQPGACEAGHRIYSYRMKHQGRCWSQEGAEAMVQFITAMKNEEWDAGIPNGDVQPISPSASDLRTS